MITFIRSSVFVSWREGLSDARGKARVLARINRAAFGNFGDCEPVGEGVSEMRIHYEPGYRVYFIQDGATICVLLSGGSKSTQRRDIAKAKRMVRDLKENKQ